MVFKKIFGRKKKVSALEGPPVKMAARGGEKPEDNRANLIQARQSPGFVTVKEWLADAFQRRADQVVLEYTAGGVGARYQVDGVWHQMPGRDRESSDVALAVMKKLANLNPQERRAKQEGEFAAKYLQLQFAIHITSQGTQQGERVILKIDGAQAKFDTLEDLGMREKMQGRLKELMGEQQGLFVFTSLPGGGLSTTLQTALRSTDRYLRDFVALVDKTKQPLPYVENVDVTEYDPQSDDMPEVLRRTLLKQPDVLVVPDISDGEFLNRLLEQIQAENKLVFTSLRSKDAVEGVVRLLALKPDAGKLAECLLGVLGQRLARKLCVTCRRPFQPNPQMLQKLGLPADGRIKALYRPFNPKTDLSEDGKELPPCEVCGGVGYRDRTAIFELLTPGDALKHAMVQQPRLEVLRKVAKQEKHRGLTEEGLFQVVRGDTSLAELQRVLQS